MIRSCLSKIYTFRMFATIWEMSIFKIDLDKIIFLYFRIPISRLDTERIYTRCKITIVNPLNNVLNLLIQIYQK